MSSNLLKTRIQNKIDYLSNWISSDTILLNGEIGIVIGTVSSDIRMKVGNGVDLFSVLPYVNESELSLILSDIDDLSNAISTVEESLSDYVPVSGDTLIQNDLSVANDLYVNGELLSSIISAIAPKIILRQYSEN